MEVLQPWLAMVPQITEMAQLSTVVEAMRAVWWEWSAVEWCEMAQRGLARASTVEEAQQVVKCLTSSWGNLRYASERWAEAGVAFPEQAAEQRFRLSLLMVQVEVEMAVHVCERWGLSVPDLSEQEAG